MAKTDKKGTVKTCKNGHQFIKSSDCPTCPQCEKSRKPLSDFLSEFAGPARRALESQNISTLRKLSQYSEKELLALHGFGPSSIPVVKRLLAGEGLKLKPGR